jgi:hypothetical protein
MGQRAIACALAAVLAGPAAAQDKGDFTVFAKRELASGYRNRSIWDVSPGVSYQLTRHVELQPILAFGWASHGNPEGETHRSFDYDAGVRSFFNFRPQKRFVPYVGAAMTFSHFDDSRPNFFRDGSGNFTAGTTPPPPAGWSANHFTLSAAAGARQWITRRVGLFAEVGLSRPLDDRYVWTGATWEKGGRDQAFRPFRSGFGVLVNLH